MGIPMFVYPHYWCNFSCSYCFTNSGKSQDEMTFVIENWEKIVADALKSGVSEVRFSGGEPLASPYYKDMVLDLMRLNMPYTLTTNGTYLKSSMGSMDLHPPTIVWLSYHPEYMSVSALEKYANMLRNGLGCKIGLNFFFEDYSNFDKGFETIRDLGVERVKVLQKTPVGRHSSSGLTQVDRHTWKHLAASAFDNGVECRLEGVLEKGSGPTTCVLNERLLLSIAPDGLVYPCCVTVGHPGSVIGDLKKQSIESIVTGWMSRDMELYCRDLLPGIENGVDKCPLELVSAESLV